METHCLIPRQHRADQYDRVGIAGFARCGVAVPAGTPVSEDISAVTCPKCLEKMAGEVELAIHGGETHHRFDGGFRTHADARTVGTCGFKRRPGEPGQLTSRVPDVTCETCLAILRGLGEAD